VETVKPSNIEGFAFIVVIISYLHMIKDARKKSSDPVQEQLRQHKDKWNKDVSSFIEAMKQYKKMLNGFPSKFHMEKSKIQDPLPADTASIISALTDSFKNLALDSNKIVSEQLEYSKTRRKKQVSKPGQTSLTSPSADLSAQLSKADDHQINLVSEASNSFTRFLSGLSRPWFGKSPERRKKTHRLSMLKIMVKLDKKLALLETEIMGKSAQSIYKVSQLFDSIEVDISKLNHNLELFVAGLKEENIQNQTTTKMPEEIVSKKEENELPKPVEKEVNLPEKLENKISPIIPAVGHGPIDLETASSMIRDFERNRHEIARFDPHIFPEMMRVRRLFSSIEDKTKLDPSFLQEVSKIYNSLLSALKLKEDVEGNSFEELKNNIRKKKKATVDSVYKMNKFAERSIKKWIGEARHWLSSDETTAARREILELVEKCRDQVELLLDYLEDDFDHKFLKEQIAELSADIVSMGNIIDTLRKTIKTLRFDKPFMNLLEQKKILDYRTDLSDKEKEMALKQIERDRVRELTKMYGGKK